jgi:hypothetical protein
MTTSPSKLDLTKPVRTRGGQSVRIICTDGSGEGALNQPVIGLFKDGVIRKYNLEGTYNFNSQDKSTYDLVNVPETVRVCIARRGREFTSQTLKGHWTEAYCIQQWGVENCVFKDIEFA